MAKRLLIIFLALLICMPTAFARKKKKKSGAIDNNVYTDATYNFKMTLADNWERKMGKPNDMKRLTMVQKDHEIPPALMQYPLMAKTPILEIFVAEDASAFTPQIFIDSLIDLHYKSKIKKEVMKELVIVSENISFTGFKKLQKNIITVDEKPAIQWLGSAHYIKDLGMGESDPRSYGVTFIVISNGDKLLIFSLTCEEMFMGKIYTEVKKMVDSIEWP